MTRGFANNLQILLIVVALATSNAWAGPFEDGVAAYKRMDYAAALRYWRPLADQGDADALWNIAVMYANGVGLPQDDLLAASYLRKAAERGYAKAQFNLAALYGEGKGVPKDHEQAVFWYRKAAEQGDVKAQFNLATHYFEGMGVSRDFQQAALWFRRAAEQGETTAQLNLAVMYGQGRGVPKDDQQAYFWSLLASVDGSADAVGNRNLLEQRLTADQRAAAQAAARDWKPRTENQSVESPGARAGESARRAAATGSGFRVAVGHIVTNNHVVKNCAQIRVNLSLQGRVLSRDSRNDVAIVAAAGDRGPVARIRVAPPRLGEDIAVAGFPLHGLLSGLNVTRGNVSSLSGPAGDSRLLQISAPVQPGNSGGPLLDTSANVVGIVVAKLDALQVAKATGDIPQNVNFALNANVLRAFLDANGIEYDEGLNQSPVAPAEVASRAARFTTLIECWR